MTVGDGAASYVQSPWIMQADAIAVKWLGQPTQKQRHGSAAAAVAVPAPVVQPKEARNNQQQPALQQPTDSKVRPQARVIAPWH